MAGGEAKAIAQIAKRIIDERGAEITRLRAELDAEKALADRLWRAMNEVGGNDWKASQAAYRKARGL